MPHFHSNWHEQLYTCTHKHTHYSIFKVKHGLCVMKKSSTICRRSSIHSCTLSLLLEASFPSQVNLAGARFPRCLLIRILNTEHIYLKICHPSETPKKIKPEKDEKQDSTSISCPKHKGPRNKAFRVSTQGREEAILLRWWVEGGCGKEFQMPSIASQNLCSL